MLARRELPDVLANLRDESLLDLESVCCAVGNARDFREPKHPLLCQVPDRDVAREREEVVLTETPHADATDAHHLPGLDARESRVRAARVKVDEFGPPPRKAVRGARDAVPLRVLPDGREQPLANVPEDGLVYLWSSIRWV